MTLSGGHSGGGGGGGWGVVAATMVVGGVPMAGASTAQHCYLCWPECQCETDPSMYPYLIVFNRLCVAHCNCPILSPFSFVCICQQVSLVFYVMIFEIVMGSCFPGHHPLVPRFCKIFILKIYF